MTRDWAWTKTTCRLGASSCLIVSENKSDLLRLGGTTVSLNRHAEQRSLGRTHAEGVHRDRYMTQGQCYLLSHRGRVLCGRRDSWQRRCCSFQQMFRIRSCWNFSSLLLNKVFTFHFDTNHFSANFFYCNNTDRLNSDSQVCLLCLQQENKRLIDQISSHLFWRWFVNFWFGFPHLSFSVALDNMSLYAGWRHFVVKVILCPPLSHPLGGMNIYLNSELN